EVADRAAEEEYKKTISRPSEAPDAPQPVEVRALESEDADRLELTELALAAREGGRRDLDRAVRGRMAPPQGLEDPSRLPAAAASELRDGHRRLEPLDDLRGMRAQQPLVGRREAVLRKDADRFEQRRANLVVEVFRRQLFLPGPRQANHDFGGHVRARAG